MRSHLHLAILLVACAPAPVVDAPAVPPTVAVVMDSLPVPDSVAHVVPEAPAPPAPRAEVEDEGCVEFTGYADGTATLTVYIPRNALPTREGEITALLPSMYMNVEQNAPRSIACDFEGGTSTVYSSIPDTLPVVVTVFDRCSARKPHATLRYSVWKDGQGGHAWRAE